MNKNKPISQDSAPIHPKCGIIMPISQMEGYPSDHWFDVNNILIDALNPGFEVRIVSEADESGIIQKNIIRNLYHNEIIVCDVSGKNPNVMFELGIRLAFDKPTIIIKDDLTDYSFDTSIIEHLEYPKDLRFAKIVEFKKKLMQKVQATYEYSIKMKENYSPFLKSFGEFKIATISENQGDLTNFIQNTFDEIQREILSLKRSQNSIYRGNNLLPQREYKFRNEILSKKIDEFVSVNTLQNKNEIFFENKMDELFNFLTESNILMKYFRRGDDLKKAMEEIIIPF